MRNTGKRNDRGAEGGREVTYTPMRGMESGKYLRKKSMTWSGVVIFSNSSKGMNRVQVKVLSFGKERQGMLTHSKLTIVYFLF